MQPQRIPIISPPPSPLDRGAGKRPIKKNSTAAKIKASDRLFLWCLLFAIPITIGLGAWFGSLGFSRVKTAARQEKVMKILVYQPTIKPRQRPRPKTTLPQIKTIVAPPPRVKASTKSLRIKTVVVPSPPAATSPQALPHLNRPAARQANLPVRHSAPPAQPTIAPHITQSAVGAHPTMPIPLRPTKAPSAAIITPPVAAPAPRIAPQPVAPPTAHSAPQPAPIEHKAPQPPPIEHKAPQPEQVEPKAPPPSRPAVADRETPELLGSFSDISLPNFDPTELNSTEVKVTWTVDPDGRVHGIKFRPTGNSDVDDAIRSAVQNYKFKPRVINGIAQPAKFEHTFDLGG